MDLWDRDQTRMLISLYRQFPCLYNAKDPDYTNKIKRNSKYEKILNAMREFKPFITTESIKKKMRTLQSQLCKERAKVLAAQRRGDEFKPKLWCYNELEVLFYYNDANEPASTSHVQEQQQQPALTLEWAIKPEMGNFGGPQLTTLETSTNVKQEIPIDTNHQVVEELQLATDRTLQLVSQIVQQQQRILSHQQQQQPPLSREEKFCNFLCAELRRVKSDDLFDDIKLEILKIVQKAIKHERLQTPQHHLHQQQQQQQQHQPPPQLQLTHQQQQQQ